MDDSPHSSIWEEIEKLKQNQASLAIELDRIGRIVDRLAAVED